MQVLDGGIANIAEGSNEAVVVSTIGTSIVIDGQRVAVAVEDAPVGRIRIPAYHRIGRDVGIEAGVHVVFALGILHFLVKR